LRKRVLENLSRLHEDRLGIGLRERRRVDRRGKRQDLEEPSRDTSVEWCHRSLSLFKDVIVIDRS
jgi:hypothetical protein